MRRHSAPAAPTTTDDDRKAECTEIGCTAPADWPNSHRCAAHHERYLDWRSELAYETSG